MKTHLVKESKGKDKGRAFAVKEERTGNERTVTLLNWHSHYEEDGRSFISHTKKGQSGFFRPLIYAFDNHKRIETEKSRLQMINCGRSSRPRVDNPENSKEKVRLLVWELL